MRKEPLKQHEGYITKSGEEKLRKQVITDEEMMRLVEARGGAFSTVVRRDIKRYYHTISVAQAALAEGYTDEQFKAIVKDYELDKPLPVLSVSKHYALLDLIERYLWYQQMGTKPSIRELAGLS